MSSRLARLPTWISHWLGYRPETPKPLPTYQVALWSFLTAFCGLSVVQAIFNYSDYFKDRNVPGIVASYVSGKEALYKTATKRKHTTNKEKNRVHPQS
jgi:4-hydroxybenzoate polyprenyltransferase